MSEFRNKSITSKGMELLAKALAGETLEFTKIELGNGRCESDVGIVERLVSPMQTLSITKITRKDSQVTLSTALKLEDITSSFDWTEIGIYAKVGNEEVLYMYGYTENSSYISKDSLNEKLINVTVLVSSVAEVTAVIDNSLVYLTQETLNTHNMDQEAHKDIRSEIEQVRESLSQIDISWGSITGKPISFIPAAHTHDERYYTESEMDSKLSSKANVTDLNMLAEKVNARTETVYVPSTNIRKSGVTVANSRYVKLNSFKALHDGVINLKLTVVGSGSYSLYISGVGAPSNSSAYNANLLTTGNNLAELHNVANGSVVSLSNPYLTAMNSSIEGTHYIGVRVRKGDIVVATIYGSTQQYRLDICYDEEAMLC